MVPALPDMGKIAADQEAEYCGEEHGDIFAPINNANLLNMRFLDEDEESDDEYSTSRTSNLRESASVA